MGPPYLALRNTVHLLQNFLALSSLSLPPISIHVSWSAFSQKFNSRFTQNFTLLTSHIDHRKMYNLTSHFSYNISHFKSLIYIHILQFTLYIMLCEV